MTEDYRALKRAVRGLYGGAAMGDRAFVRARLAILPLRDLLPLFPREGRVLDLGCGRGVLANLLALARPRLRVLGMDVDPLVIAVARRTARGRANVAFEVGDALALPARGDYDAVACVDLLHHLPGEAHAGVLQGMRSLLRPGGALIVKEIDVRPRWKYLWNCLHDAVVARGARPACRASAALVRMVAEAGYANATLHHIHSVYPYPHYAVTARLGAAAHNGGNP